MRYFKIKVGYDKDEFVSIDETELELALHVFLTEGKAIFKNGVVRGKDIIGITEDWHKAMGINPEWKLGTDDWNEIEKRGLKTAYKGMISGAKDRVHHLIKTKQEHLIGKNVEIPELEAPKIELREGKTKSISELLTKDKLV